MHQGHVRLRRRVLVGQALLAMVCATAFSSTSEGMKAPGELVFREVWGYVVKGAEQALTGSEPITDVAYFSAQVNDIGRLDQTISRPQFSIATGLVSSAAKGHPRRVHLVVSAPSNRSLMYWCLAKDTQTRGGLISDIVAAGRDFDGVQIDFETIRPEEGQAYLSFLRELKAKVGPAKVLGVAVPARTKKQEDAFDYAAIAAIADRVLVMAYDEHWRTGSPGPIASLDWCRQVCGFARQNVPSEKLVMGLPLYGRSWQMETLAQSLTWAETQQVLKSLAKAPSRTKDGTPLFEYLRPATLKVYYEDIQSLSAKLGLYRDAGVQAVGFWRIGQGPSDLWRLLTIGY